MYINIIPINNKWIGTNEMERKKSQEFQHDLISDFLKILLGKKENCIKLK